MAKLPPDKDNLLDGSNDFREEEALENVNTEKDSGNEIQKHLDNSFEEYYLSQEGLVPEWMDG